MKTPAVIRPLCSARGHPGAETPEVPNESVYVVLDRVLFSQHVGFSQGSEQLNVQELMPESTVA